MKVTRKNSNPLWEITMTAEVKGWDGPRVATKRVRSKKGDEAMDNVLDSLAEELGLPEPSEEEDGIRLSDTDIYALSIGFRRIG